MMHIPKSLLACTSKDDTRYVLNHVYVDVIAKKAIATDGHVLVALPIEPDPDEVSGYVPTEAILAAAKLPKNQKGCLTHHETSTTVHGTVYPNPYAEDDKPPPFPAWQSLIPKHQDAPPMLSCDGTLFAAVTHALTPEGNKKPYITVHTDPKDPNKPLVLKSHYESMADAIALVMPVRHDAVTPHVCANSDTVDMWRSRAISAEELTKILQSKLDECPDTSEQIRILTEERDAARTETAALQAQMAEAPSSMAEVCGKLQAQYHALTEAYEAVTRQYESMQDDYNEVLRDMTALLAQETSL